MTYLKRLLKDVRSFFRPSHFRVELEISDAKIPELGRMMEAGGFKNPEDLLNFSKNVFAWCLRRASEGKAIGAYDEKSDSFIEVTSHVLDHARVANIL